VGVPLLIESVHKILANSVGTMTTQFFDQQFVGALPPPKAVPGDGGGIRYRRSNVDLSLSHGKAVTRVGVDYTIEDGGGTAEVSYAYPIGTLVLVSPNRPLPVQFLRQGMRFLLEDGGLARVTKVSPPEVFEAPTRTADGKGNVLCRILGRVHYSGNYPHFDLHFDDGTIETTPGHRFWCVRRKGWIPACDFTAGDLMRSRDGHPIRVRSVSGIYWKFDSLYNLEVEDHHNYYVGDLKGASVWSHNGLANGCRVPKAAVVTRDPTPGEFEKLAFGRPGKKEWFDFPWSGSFGEDGESTIGSKEPVRFEKQPL
jgi:hypothetical protein